MARSGKAGADHALLLRRVRDTILRYRMVAEGETVVVGVSGGGDSTALVYLLGALRHELRLSLHTAHFNHHLRVEAAEDAAFVAALSRRLGLPYHEGGGETMSYAAREGLSLEDAARRLRYEFLFAVAREVGAHAVATGHTLDDQAETVVMRLLRGSGLRGLTGIPPVRLHEGVRVIRPLIEVSRIQIRAYLRKIRVSWREDLTNRNRRIPRNLVRAVFLPAFEGYNPDVRQTLARLADLLRDDAEALEQLAAPYLDAALSEDPGLVRISLERFTRLPVALQRRALREAVRRVHGNLRGIGLVHIEGARRLALDGHTGAVAELPGGLRVRRLLDAVEVAHGEPPKPAPGEYRLEIPGSVVASEFGVQLVASEVDPDSGARAAAADSAAHAVVLDRARTGDTLIVRAALPGERFAPIGMRGRTKKVSEYMIERRIPRHRRRFIPILATPEGEILWIVGLRAAERARVTPESVRTVKVEARRLRA